MKEALGPCFVSDRWKVTTTVWLGVGFNWFDAAWVWLLLKSF